MNNSAIMYDGIIESYFEQRKTVLTNFNEKNITCIFNVHKKIVHKKISAF